jgi:uncharacterized protein (TIGR03437 family)
LIASASVLILGLLAQAPLAPRYDPNHLVNGASGTVGPMAPNTIMSLYGTNLSFHTRTIHLDDIRGNVLPTTMPGTGVRVLIANQAASLYFVSPTQVNFVVPSNLISGRYDLQLLRDGLAGPKIPVELREFAPQLFVMGDRFVIAQRKDSSLVWSESPVRPGDFVVIYATGMGRTLPELPSGQIAGTASPIARYPDFRVYLDGVPVPFDRMIYAGLTPGTAGLYQVNFRLPDDTPENPEIRLGLDEPLSEPDVRLAVTHAPPADEESVDPAASPEEPDPGSR